MRIMLLPLRILLGAAGVFFIWCAVCLREDREKRIHSKLGDIWIQIDEFRTTAVPIHRAILTVSARRVSLLLDRIFGEGLITIRALSVSWTLSWVSSISVDVLTYNTWDWQLVAIVTPLVGFGLIVVYFRRLYWIGTALMVCQCGVGLVLIFLNGLSSESQNAVFVAMMTFAIICDFVIVTLTRRVLQHYARQPDPTTSDFLGLSSATFAVPLITVLAPMAAPNVLIFRKFSISGLPDLSTQMNYHLFLFFNFLQSLGESNVYSNLGLVVLLLLVASLALHVVTWELVQGPLYAAQRFGIASRHKTLALIGGSLLTAAFVGKLPDLNTFIRFF